MNNNYKILAVITNTCLNSMKFEHKIEASYKLNKLCKLWHKISSKPSENRIHLHFIYSVR